MRSTTVFLPHVSAIPDPDVMKGMVVLPGWIRSFIQSLLQGPVFCYALPRIVLLLYGIRDRVIRRPELIFPSVLFQDPSLPFQ
jgi:hypothetical protein